MRGLLMATLLSLAMPGFAQPPAPGQGGADGVPLVVPNTSVRTMQASGSGRGYQITVALPSRPPRQAGYPVIYVLDANIMLMTAIDAARAYDRRQIGRAPSELQSLMRISYAVFCFKKKTH